MRAVAAALPRRWGPGVRATELTAPIPRTSNAGHAVDASGSGKSSAIRFRTVQYAAPFQPSEGEVTREPAAEADVAPEVSANAKGLTRVYPAGVRYVPAPRGLAA